MITRSLQNARSGVVLYAIQGVISNRCFSLSDSSIIQNRHIPCVIFPLGGIVACLKNVIWFGVLEFQLSKMQILWCPYYKLIDLLIVSLEGLE
ncbi:hypothetical protein VNO78_03564 [Psophocarpus tetragonolobus]|uniref:Uncharacterized protein n=1 Tax=Psophocarpus tetragonolobus TaxID=3891 RepID=A0AAN9T0S0_PSOTE